MDANVLELGTRGDLEANVSPAMLATFGALAKRLPAALDRYLYIVMHIYTTIYI